MTTSNKSDSLQPPKGGGFSPTLLMSNVDIRVILKDSTNMDALNKGFVDLVVTSPPYQRERENPHS